MTIISPKNGLFIQNDSGTTIPPRSVVVVTSVETWSATKWNQAMSVLHVQKYNAGFGVVLVTGDVTIPAGATGTSPTGWSPTKKFGTAFSDDVIYVSIDPSAADPVVGEMWGPVPGAWTIARGGLGFICLGFSSNGGYPKRALFRRETPKYLWGKNTTAVTTGSLTTPSSFTANIWLPTGPAASTPYAVATQSDFIGITVYNYSPNLVNASTGLPCQIEPYGNRWQLKWIDC